MRDIPKKDYEGDRKRSRWKTSDIYQPDDSVPLEASLLEPAPREADLGW